MKKNVYHWLIMLLLITPLFISCEEKNMGEAIITIDDESTKNIGEYCEISIKGTVEAPSGSVIENISFMVEFMKQYREDPMDEDFIWMLETERVSGIGEPEFTKISENKYKFEVTQENIALSTKCTVIRSIRINARVKDGERSSKTWYIKPQFKI